MPADKKFQRPGECEVPSFENTVVNIQCMVSTVSMNSVYTNYMVRLTLLSRLRTIGTPRYISIFRNSSRLNSSPDRIAPLRRSIGIRVPCASHDIFMRFEAMAKSMARAAEPNFSGSHPFVAAGMRDHRVRTCPNTEENIHVADYNGSR